MNKNPLYDLAKLSRDHLRKTQYSKTADIQLAQSFANDLDSVLDCTLPEQTTGEQTVRALNYAPIVLGMDVPNELFALYNAARSAFGQVRWTEFYEEDSWSKPFLHSFANGEGIGPDGRLLHNEIILGLFLLGPETTYPEHAHPAEEFYIVLAGNPEFKVGANSDFELQNEGSVVLHHSEISHSIRSSKEPFYGIFGWRGDIGARSWYRNDMNDANEQKKYPRIAKS